MKLTPLLKEAPVCFSSTSGIVNRNSSRSWNRGLAGSVAVRGRMPFSDFPYISVRRWPDFFWTFFLSSLLKNNNRILRIFSFLLINVDSSQCLLICPSFSHSFIVLILTQRQILHDYPADGEPWRRIPKTTQINSSQASSETDCPSELPGVPLPANRRENLRKTYRRWCSSLSLDAHVRNKHQLKRGK